MSLINLFNNDKPIGVVNSNNDAIRSLSKRKYKLITTLVLTANIIMSTLTGCSSNIKTNDGSNSSPIVTEVPEFDNDKFNEDRLYDIYDGEVDQLVNLEYLNTHSYIPIDNIETKHEFITYNLTRLKEEYPGDDDRLDSLFTTYSDLYYKYITSDIKDAYYTKKFFDEKQNYYISLLEEAYGVRYIAKAISYDEYIKDKAYLNNRTIINYTVKEGDTLTEIINRYVDNKDEYNLALFYAITNNIFEEDDYDILKPGQKLKLAFVEREDFSLLDMEEDHDPFNYINFISKYKNGVKALVGDIETYNLSKKVIAEVEECIQEYESESYNQEEFIRKLKDVCNDIYLLTGDKYQAPVVNKKVKR